MFHVSWASVRSLPASYTYSRNTSDPNGLVYNWLREAWRELRLGHTIMTTLVMLSWSILSVTLVPCSLKFFSFVRNSSSISSKLQSNKFEVFEYSSIFKNIKRVV